MKKLIYGISLLAILGIGFVGCKKLNHVKHSQNTNQNNEQPNSNILKSITGEITQVDGLLKFQSYDDVKSTIESLGEIYRDHENSFINQYPDISGDSLTKIEELIGYNEFETFEEFEESHAHNSLRKVLFDHEENWLNSDQSTEEPISPMDFIIDLGFQTILNSQAELIVGDTIYKIYPNGYVQIPNLDFALLEVYRNSNNPADVKGGIKVGFEKSENDCRGHIAYPSIGWSKVSSGDARIKYKIAIRTFPWSRYVIAKTKAYRKRNWFGWKKVRTFIRTSVYGDISNWTTINGEQVANCEEPVQFNTSYPYGGVYADKYNTKSLKHKVWVTSKTKSTWVKGYHHIARGPFTKNSELIW